jgi:transposase
VAHGTTDKIFTRVRERAVRMVQEHASEYPSQWAAIRSVGEKLGCSHRGCAGGCGKPSVTPASALSHRRRTPTAEAARTQKIRAQTRE